MVSVLNGQVSVSVSVLVSDDEVSVSDDEAETPSLVPGDVTTWLSCQDFGENVCQLGHKSSRFFIKNVLSSDQGMFRQTETQTITL